MSRVEIHVDRVVLQLTAAEKALSLRRRDIVIDRNLISSALITVDPWVWLRGVRSPGTHVPGRFAYGTWRSLSGRDFALIRRGVSAVVIDLDAPNADQQVVAEQEGFDELARVIVSTARAVELIEALKLDASEQKEVITTDTKSIKLPKL